MFSEMIQNLLNSGGKTAAMQRYSSLSNQVNNFKAKLTSPAVPQNENPIDTIYPNTSKANAFENILQTSAPANFGNLLFGGNAIPSGIVAKNVSASVYKHNLPNIAQAVNSTVGGSGVSQATATMAQSPQVVGSKAQLLNMIDKISEKNGVDEKLVRALIKQESGFNPNATSKAGAMGLMQLMPSTAKGLGVNDPYNPVQNVEGGVKYLKSMLNKYNGNVILALAAYNAGPNAVDKYDGVPPYKETQNYVRNILANYLQ